MWTKVRKNDGLHRPKPALERKKPAVSRAASLPRSAKLILPRSYVAGSRVDIYVDGDRLAFAFGDEGAYKLWSAMAGSVCSNVSIPAGFSSRIPFGTTDVELEREGDMLVLDLASLPPVEVKS